MIVFRADGNEFLGMGHVMRCLSIADEFSRNNMECIFISSDDKPKKIIEQKGYKCISLNVRYTDKEGELEALRQHIESLNPQIMIVDSYYVTQKYFDILGKYCTVVYIDDLCENAFDVNYVINYNVYADENDYINLYKKYNIKLPRLLLGGRYIPLRKQFHYIENKPRNEICKDVFVSTGGADYFHISHKLVKYICEKNIYVYRFHILVGSMNADIDNIERMCMNNDYIIVHKNVSNVKDIMCECDIAVSAAGSTLYELCACGIPTITYTIADNQLKGAKCFGKLGLMKYIGDFREEENSPELIISELIKLDKDIVLRKEISNRMRDLIDGNGTKNIVKEILQG